MAKWNVEWGYSSRGVVEIEADTKGEAEEIVDNTPLEDLEAARVDWEAEAFKA